MGRGTPPEVPVLAPRAVVQAPRLQGADGGGWRVEEMILKIPGKELGQARVQRASSAGDGPKMPEPALLKASSGWVVRDGCHYFLSVISGLLWPYQPAVSQRIRTASQDFPAGRAGKHLRTFQLEGLLEVWWLQ